MFVCEFSYGERDSYLEFIISHLHLIFSNLSFLSYRFLRLALRAIHFSDLEGGMNYFATQGGFCTLISLGNLYWRHAHMLSFPFIEKYDIIALFSSMVIESNSQTFPT